MKLVGAECEYQEGCPDKKRGECPREQSQCGLRFMITLERSIDLTIDDLELSQDDINIISERMHNTPRYNNLPDNRGFGRYDHKTFRREAYFYIVEKSHREG